jgi:hypothetical protein
MRRFVTWNFVENTKGPTGLFGKAGLIFDNSDRLLSWPIQSGATEAPHSIAAARCFGTRSTGPQAIVYLIRCAGDVVAEIMCWFTQKSKLMPKYLIEREIPGAGNLSQEQLRTISQKSCSVLMKLGPAVQWLHSYVTGDKVYCVYIAPNEQAVREHAKQGGFPANRVSQIVETIDPTTAEG